MTPRIRSALLSALLVFVAFAASAEFFGYVYLRHVVGLEWKPAWLGWAGEHRRIGDWGVPHPEWGSWRHANAAARHESDCFSVPMRTNSAGARDRERTADGARRTLVLGDSFAEGFGVPDEQRVTNLLEARLGREFLNFGVAGQGPAQYQLIYKHFAPRFAHDDVLIMLLASNDFTDNDYDYWRKRSGAEAPARPYFQRTPDGGFRIFYPVKRQELEEAREEAKGFWSRLWNPVRTNSWAIRTFEFVTGQGKKSANYAGYYEVTDEQLDAVVWSLSEIRKAAGNRPITVALLPLANDITRAGKDGTGNLPARLEPRLRALNIDMIDLLPPLRGASANVFTLYQRCDGHWTEAGNKAAADALLAAGRFGPVAPGGVSASSSPAGRP